MSRDGFTVAGPHGEIKIEGDALAALVVAAAERTAGVRVRRPRRGLDISIAGDVVRVELELRAKYGTNLPNAARDVQAAIAAALGAATGLVVGAVDVSVEELDP